MAVTSAVGMGKQRELQPGAVLGRYELVMRVAAGGMGEVWAARLKGSRGFQKIVAIKTLLAELAHNPGFEQMFLDEAALASRIKHPNVVQVIDLGDHEHVLFQVMEWVSGDSLWAVMRAAAKKGGVPLDVAARILAQVCAGLHAAHELRGEDGKPIGLVHRDVTPQNILITPHGVAKVVDFGVAKFAGRSVAKTRVGELRGKVPYMAPEHIEGEELDRRADVFSLGLLFYQLVSGTHPFLADDDRLTMVRISSDTPAEPLRTKAPAVSDALSAVIDKALSKKRDSRMATAAELLRALEQAVPSCALQSTNDAVAEYMTEVVGDTIELRAQELREALRKLDGEPVRPDATPTVRPGDAAPGSKARAKGKSAADDDDGDEPSALSAPSLPSAVSSMINTVDVEDPPEPAVEGWRATWPGRHPRAVVAALAVLLVGGAVALSSGADEGAATSSPVVSAAPAAPAPSAPAETARLEEAAAATAAPPASEAAASSAAPRASAAPVAASASPSNSAAPRAGPSPGPPSGAGAGAPSVGTPPPGTVPQGRPPQGRPPRYDPKGI